MPSKSVAVTGDAVLVPTGDFVAGPVTYVSYNNLSIGGVGVISGVSCTFTNSSTGATDLVVLSANSTTLQKGLSGVLVNGDSATGALGNQIQINTSSKLTSG
jgi:hypothetical protein